MNEDQRVRNAENEIASILKNLESRTGMLVESICIMNLDMSDFVSAPKMQRQVKIDLQRIPGTQWCTG